MCVQGEYPGPQAFVGEPWAYVLRDVLRYASTAEEATAIMAAANRTCPIYVGIGAQPAGAHVSVR